MPKFANMGQVILKQKLGTKCLFLRRFVSLAVKQGINETFVPSEEIFEDYCQAVAVWTDGDNLHGQIKYLIKKAAFYKERRKKSTALCCSTVFKCPSLKKNIALSSAIEKRT